MINGIHHLAISTADLDRLVSFYSDVLGWEVVFRFDWDEGNALLDQITGLTRSAARVAMLKAGNAYVEFFEYRSPVPAPNDPARAVCDHGYAHICLDVTDIDFEYERLGKAGMTFHAPPPSAEDFGDAGVRAIYGRDPDGNVIELQEILTDALPIRLPA